MLAYNCSPSFNWEANIDKATIAKFQREIGAMGYKFQFVTLAGFHSLNHGMFELARGYKAEGMAAYSRLQQAEFASEKHGYSATRHQREVGTGYFDQVALTISGGASSTTALGDSTEAAQFKKEAGGVEARFFFLLPLWGRPSGWTGGRRVRSGTAAGAQPGPPVATLAALRRRPSHEGEGWLS